MNSTFYMPIYLNRNLILDLYSMFIDGYLESKSVRFVKDKNNTLRAQNGGKNQKTKGEKTVDICKNTDKENYKEEDIYLEQTGLTTEECTNLLENRLGLRDELTIKKIYTSFYYFANLKKHLFRNNLVQKIDGNDIMNGSLKCGQLVEFKGKITTESMLFSINNIIDIIEAYDSKELDKLLINSNLKDGSTNYTIILKQFKNFVGYLNRNNTCAMIARCNECKIAMSVNMNYFSDKNAYMYDNALDNCMILCKITKLANRNEKINMMAKTCMENYYKEFFSSTKPYFDLLNEKNIIIPMEYLSFMDMNGPCTQVIPIAMYV